MKLSMGLVSETLETSASETPETIDLDDKGIVTSPVVCISKSAPPLLLPPPVATDPPLIYELHLKDIHITEFIEKWHL